MTDITIPPAALEAAARAMVKSDLAQDLRDILAEKNEIIARLTARVEELEGALKRMIDLCTLGANPNAFNNGNLDSTGTIDEGDVIAGRIIDAARAAITKGESRD